MKKSKALLLALLMTFSFSEKAIALVDVPKDIEKLSPAEAYKKGYERGLKEAEKDKSQTRSNSEKDDGKDEKEKKTYKWSRGEVTIESVKFGKDRKDKDIVIIEYKVKNLSDESTYASSIFTPYVFQDGVELDSAYVSIDEDNSNKKIKAGVEIDKCFRTYYVDDSINKIDLEFGDYDNKIEVSFDIEKAE